MGDVETGAVLEVAILTGLAVSQWAHQEDGWQKENKTHQLSVRSQSEDNLSKYEPRMLTTVHLIHHKCCI